MVGDGVWVQSWQTLSRLCRYSRGQWAEPVPGSRFGRLHHPFVVNVQYHSFIDNHPIVFYVLRRQCGYFASPQAPGGGKQDRQLDGLSFDVIQQLFDIFIGGDIELFLFCPGESGSQATALFLLTFVLHFVLHFCIFSCF